MGNEATPRELNATGYTLMGESHPASASSSSTSARLNAHSGGNYGVISVAQETHGAVRSQPPAACELFDRASPGGNATDRQVVAAGPSPPNWRACADRKILGTATRQDRRPRSRPIPATVRGEAHYDRNRSQARTGLCRPEDMQGDDKGGNALQDEGRPRQEAL